MASIGNVTVRMKVDTEALETLRVLHLKCAADIADAIERLSKIGEKDNEDDGDDS